MDHVLNFRILGDTPAMPERHGSRALAVKAWWLEFHRFDFAQGAVRCRAEIRNGVRLDAPVWSSAFRRLGERPHGVA